MRGFFRPRQRHDSVNESEISHPSAGRDHVAGVVVDPAAIQLSRLAGQDDRHPICEDVERGGRRGGDGSNSSSSSSSSNEGRDESDGDTDEEIEEYEESEGEDEDEEEEENEDEDEADDGVRGTSSHHRHLPDRRSSSHHHERHHDCQSHHPYEPSHRARRRRRRSRRRWHLHPTSSRSGHGTKASVGLALMPLELQLMVLSHLDLPALVNLRQMCQLYRQLITPDFVRARFVTRGRPGVVLRGCCTECLCMPGLDRLILDSDLPRTEWRSMCFRCWRDRLTRDDQIKPWPPVEIASGAFGYICQFCTWPVLDGHGADSTHQRLHAHCRARRRLVIFSWLTMAFIQFGLGMLAAILAWTIFRHQKSVIIPATIDFGLAVIALVAFFVRLGITNQRTYAIALAIELLITLIRIPPVAYSARGAIVYRNRGSLPRFGFGVFLLNLIFRFLDVLGYGLLNWGYDPRRVFLASLPMRKKILYGSCTLLVWFAFIPF
ncbi:hypothetical protein F4780DRAFT_781649 [Xylariomycetidae sp. FL0641]|nr:hypothetical protein F4780DRAFT_781649 [Xylariomycetidae sp. FL0641]